MKNLTFKIPPPLRENLENFFQTDFSSVNLHMGQEAAMMNARAFTYGNDIYFSPGHFDPDSEEGIALLVHEIAHVVQQREGKVASTKLFNGLPLNDNADLEKEADNASKNFLKGKKSQLISKYNNIEIKQPPIIQRKVLEVMMEKDSYSRLKKKHAGHSSILYGERKSLFHKYEIITIDDEDTFTSRLNTDDPESIEALKGRDVDTVWYKVKNKSDNLYVIKGSFRKKPKVVVTVSVDWDAMSTTLKPKYEPKSTAESKLGQGLKDLQQFHDRFGSKIPLTHFICPAYFTRGAADSKYFSEKISNFFTKNTQDEIGLHIHTWRTLIEASGVKWIDENYATSRGDYKIKFDSSKKSDIGMDIPLGVYSVDQIVKILNMGKKLLIDHIKPLKDCRGFRCGVWFANDDVMEALEKAKFTYDSSAVDAAFFEKLILDKKVYPTMQKLYTWVEELWSGTSKKVFLKNTIVNQHYKGKITEYSQPKMILPALLEIPDTGVLAEYITQDQMLLHIKNVVGEFEKDKQMKFACIGCHVGTTQLKHPVSGQTSIESLLKTVKSIKGIYGDEVIFLTTGDAGKVWKKHLAFQKSKKLEPVN